MAEIPPAWLWVSGICFGMSIVLNLALIIGGIMFWSKVGPLVEDLRNHVKKLGDRVNEITSTAKQTVDIVHTRTEKILGSAEEASTNVSQRIGAASTALTTAFIAMRVIGFVRSMANEQKSIKAKKG